jgi:heat shock protein HtpX
MVAALQRLRQLQDEPDDMPRQLAAFGIRSGPAWMQLFSSHPPLERRIEALLKT